jgi:hypothetical protein
MGIGTPISHNRLPVSMVSSTSIVDDGVHGAKALLPRAEPRSFASVVCRGRPAPPERIRRSMPRPAHRFGASPPARADPRTQGRLL